MPTVTIGIPFFNPGFRFTYALKSVFAQTFDDWELILVDDGSTDESSSLAGMLNDSRVKFVRDGYNRGLPTRLNQIAECAKGEILVRMDADDLMHPCRVAKLVEALEMNPEANIAWSASISIDSELRAIGRSRHRSAHVSEYEVFRSGGILHPTIAAARNWFRSNPYRPAYVRAEDRELFVRTFRTAKYTYLDETLYYYFHIGNVRPAAYAASYRTERMVLREYGPARIGRKTTTKLLIRSHFKSLLLIAASKLGAQNGIFRHQPVSLSKTESAEFENALNVIRRQELPFRGHV